MASNHCELWGITPAGWITDYVIVAVCVLTFCTACMGRDSTLTQLSMLFSVATGLAYGAGGVAHMLLYLYVQEGQQCGSAWTDFNIGWMYAWLGSLAFGPFSGGSLLAMALNMTAFSGECCIGIVLTYVACGAIAGYECYLFAMNNLETSGAIGGYFQMGALSLALLAIVVGGIRRGCGGGLGFLLCSVLCYLAGGFVQMFLPGKLPDVFNHNAVFHVFVILACLFAGCAFQSSASTIVNPLGSHLSFSNHYDEEARLVSNASRGVQGQQEPETCCFCFSFGPKKQPQEWQYASNS